MNNIANENLISFAEAARRMDCSERTVWNWSRHGVNGRKLESIRVGGLRRTSVEALGRFAVGEVKVNRTSAVDASVLAAAGIEI